MVYLLQEIQRICQWLNFGMQEKEARRDEKLRFTCKCSFLEIYNEQILDLLEPSSNNLQVWIIFCWKFWPTSYAYKKMHIIIAGRVLYFCKFLFFMRSLKNREQFLLWSCWIDGYNEVLSYSIYFDYARKLNSLFWCLRYR